MCELAGFFWILKAGGILWIFFSKKNNNKIRIDRSKCGGDVEASKEPQFRRVLQKAKVQP
jgi:hypothetical protein